MKPRILVCTVILAQFLIAWAKPSSATVEISGTIAGDTTWTNTDTIIVTGDVTVTGSATLTIDAGTIVLFNPETGLYIQGQLTAEGNSGNRILFTSSADTADGSPVAGEWKWVKFEANSDGILRNCDLRYADTCVYIDRSSPELDRCVIEDFSSRGIYVDGSSSNPPITPVIEHCVIGQNDLNLQGTGVGIYVYQRVNVTISGCEVSNCRYGMEFFGNGTLAPHFQVTGCEIRDHASRGVYTHADG